MKKAFNFASIRLVIIITLCGVLLLAAVPHTATVSPQPIIVNTANHFRAESVKPNLSPVVPVQSDKPQVMAAAYYSLQDKLRTSISLNHKGLLPLEVRPTLFNLAGERLEVPPVTIDPTSFRVFNLTEWTAAGGETFEQGSLQLFYRGKDLLLGAQIKMIDSDSSLIFDEQLSEPNSMRSSRLEGLWRMPDHNSQLHIVISNTSDLRQVASIKIEGIVPQEQEPKELILEPHQTIVINPTQELFDAQISLMAAGGMTITHSGRPGSLIARTMIANPATGYSSSMQFIDPGKSRSSRLHGAGLRLGAAAGEEMTPVIVSRNISDRTATLRGRIYYTTSEGKQGEMALRAVRLNPGEVEAWEIREVAALQRAGIKSAGLEFEYNTQPGSVMVSALSVGSRGNQVFHIPMLDPSAQTSSTGVYPFYLDYGSSTVVYIKNTSKEDRKYIAHLNYEGGTYMIGARSIAAGETVAIDVRSLRNSQEPDAEGGVIPLDVERGQVRWTIIQEEGKELLAMIGRAEQVYEGRAMSSTYACQSCCGDFAVGEFITPSIGEVQVGQTVQMHAFEVRSDCYGWEYPVEQSASWSSSNTQVATVDGNEVTFIGAGQTTIKASWNSSVSVSTQCSGGPGFLPGPEPIGPVTCCNSNTQPRSESTSVQVAASPDHLVLLAEQQGYTRDLPDGGTCVGLYFIRQLVFQVVSQDSNGAGPVGNVRVEERFDSVTTNTCLNGQPQASACTLTINKGTFIESISTGCGSQNGPVGCGYDINWRWYWCGNGSQGIVTLASLNAQVRRDSVTLNGRSSEWPSGTAFRE